jgi:hypothetical protein
MVDREAVPRAIERKREAGLNPEDFMTLHEQNVRRSLALRQENEQRAKLRYQESMYSGDEDDQRDALDVWILAHNQLQEAVQGVQQARPQNQYTPEEQAFLGRLQTNEEHQEAQSLYRIGMERGLKRNSPELFNYVRNGLGHTGSNAEGPLTPDEVLNIASEKFKLKAEDYNNNVRRLDALKRAGEYRS